MSFVATQFEDNPEPNAWYYPALYVTQTGYAYWQTVTSAFQFKI